MYNLEMSNFKIDSDFDMRVIRQEGNDIDIMASIDDRVLNLVLDGTSAVMGRIQFPKVKNILFRINNSKDLNLCTIHILDSIDLFSAIANFEVDCDKTNVFLKQEFGYVLLHLKNINC